MIWFAETKRPGNMTTDEVKDEMNEDFAKRITLQDHAVM